MDGNLLARIGAIMFVAVAITATVIELNRKDEPAVSPALPLYRWLLTNGVRREKLECKGFASGLAAAWLGPELALDLEAAWAEGVWMPQEALGTEQLRSVVPG